MVDDLKVTSGGNVRNRRHGRDLVNGLDDLYGSGKFADVKMVCGDGALWSHRALLAAVSPVLRGILSESGAEDVVTLIMPHLRRAHLKLVLDYVYRGSMYLRAYQMAHVIGVIEVLHLKCGVSVSKRQDSECDWVEEGEFDDVSGKAFNDLFHFIKREPGGGQDTKSALKLLSDKLPSSVSFTKMKTTPTDPELDSVPKMREEDFEEGEPVEVKPIAAKKAKLSLDDSSAVEEVFPESSDEAEDVEGAFVKCVMCGKVFNHQSNLRVHIQSHLGSKAKLRSCRDCDRNFRSATEHELHVRAHEMARKIGRRRKLKKERRLKILNRSRRSLVKLSAKTLNSAKKRGNLYKKYVEKVLKQQRKAKQKLKAVQHEKGVKEAGPSGKVKLKIKVDPNKFKQRSATSLPSTPSMLAPLLKTQPSPDEQNRYECSYCPKVFSSRSSFMRHSRAQHQIDTRSREFLDSITVDNNKRKLSTPSLPSAKRPKIRLSISSPAKHGHQRKKTVNNHQETPRSSIASPLHYPGSSPGYGASPTHPGSKGIRRSVEQDLTCPTCDKVFLAKSIFERHLKTYKHGRYQLMEGADKVPEYIPEGGTNHMNLVLQPTMEVDGREVNKFECHLCHQVFLRVKDLAKHRQRMCTAWLN